MNALASGSTVTAAASQGSGDWTSADWIALAAVAIPATIALITLAMNGIRSERSRRRQLYGEALGATFDYREFAYVVRRRQRATPAEERIRISAALRLVQRDLDRYSALVQTERSREVERAFTELVGSTRRVAGGYMHESWKGSGIDSDAEMNMVGIDFSGLDVAVAGFLDAVRDDLRWWRF